MHVCKLGTGESKLIYGICSEKIVEKVFTVNATLSIIISLSQHKDRHIYSYVYKYMYVCGCHKFHLKYAALNS